MRLRVFVEPQQGATYAQQLAVARTAEETGFDAFFRSDHVQRIGAGDAGPGPTDSWVTLGALARETSTIKLGTMVSSATFRLPGMLALAVAQVDEMSGGRVEVGLGAGWYDGEHDAYGIPFPPAGERFDRLEEQLEILTRFWSTPAGTTFSFTGRHYTLTDCPALPRPAADPHPPVIVGGRGAKRTPRLAASYADEYNVPFQTPETTAGHFDVVRAACEAAGRDPATMTFSAAQTVCCAADPATLRHRAARIGQPLDALRAGGVAGTPQEVAARLRAFADAGADRVYLQVLDLDDLDHIRLLAAEVMPLVG